MKKASIYRLLATACLFAAACSGISNGAGVAAPTSMYCALQLGGTGARPATVSVKPVDSWYLLVRAD